MSDQLISLGSENAKSRPNHPMRLVVIKAEPHKSKGRPGKGSTGQNCDGFLRIVTNLLDVPAEIIAILYQYRWTIEIFFRYFKHLLGCRHLLSAKCRLATSPQTDQHAGDDGTVHLQ
ncbi:MAG: transposase, partial [Planctomycetaceae bacterium]